MNRTSEELPKNWAMKADSRNGKFFLIVRLTTMNMEVRELLENFSFAEVYLSKTWSFFTFLRDQNPSRNPQKNQTDSGFSAR